MEQSEVPSGLKGQIDRLREMAAEFLQQLGLNIEHVRQSPGIHRDAVHQLLSRNNRTANAAVPK